MEVGAAPPYWQQYVRDTLDELQRRLDGQELELSYDPSSAWPMVRGVLTDGRQVIIPIGRGVLCAPPPLARSPKNLLSPWVIRCTQGEEDTLVHVPWWGFKRDNDWLVDLSSKRTEFTGWPAIGLNYAQGVDHKQTAYLHPEAIIVLQVREGHDDVDYGWYVRTRNSRELVQLPVAACCALAYVMRTDRRYRDEELLKTAHKTDHQRMYIQRFHPLAIATYRGYRNRVREASKKDAPPKKRPREDAPPATCETCVVCLEERESTQVRCHAGTCAAKVCATCHADSRGLCPICDRGSINAVYPCERCYKLTPLREYGYPCLNCDGRNLCKTCYAGFRECCSCESL